MNGGELQIRLGPLEFDGSDSRPVDSVEILLGVQAELTIEVGGRHWFRQPMFPVVELAASAASWLSTDGDFLFDTMEAEESPFLWVRKTHDKCELGAAWQLFEIRDGLPLQRVRRAFAGFVSEVVESANVELGLDVSRVVNGAAR